MDDSMEYTCPDCGTTMIDIGADMLQCPECDHEACKDMFDKALLIEVVRNCRKALQKFDLTIGDFSYLPKQIEDVLEKVKSTD